MVYLPTFTVVVDLIMVFMEVNIPVPWILWDRIIQIQKKRQQRHAWVPTQALATLLLPPEGQNRWLADTKR